MIEQRKIYRHIKGKIFYLIGTAKDENKNTVVIITDLADGEVYTRPIALFEGKEASFQVVTPT
jgi:hypothetical protein